MIDVSLHPSIYPIEAEQRLRDARRDFARGRRGMARVGSRRSERRNPIVVHPSERPLGPFLYI